jgi:hypothetical protein
MHLNSFLIRCWRDGERAEIFIAQHVQSGDSFRSNDWAQIGEWVRLQSRLALSAVHPADAPELGQNEPEQPEPEPSAAKKADAQ